MKSGKNTTDSFYYYCLGLLIGFITIFSIYSVNILFTFSNTKHNFVKNEISLFTNQKSVQIPILIYHYVEFVKDPNDTIRKSLDIIPPIFEAQVATLKEAGYTFLTASDINQILEGKKIMPKKPVILSFDDGYEDFYTDVMPILQKYNAKAVAYIISGLIDTPNYLKTDQVNDIKKTNLVELACHSVTHLSLGSASIDTATYEIVGCKKEMMNKFGINTVSFAYPYGSHDPFLYPILARAGFKNATTTEAGTQITRDNIFNIPRLRAGIRAGEELTSYIENEVNIAKTPIPLVEKVRADEYSGE